MKQIEEAITGNSTARSRRLVKSAVDDVVADVRRSYPAATIRVTEYTTLWVDVDKTFNHAIRHGLENGIEHADRDTPTVTVEIDESPNTGRVEIRIDDEGPPIPAMELYALDDHHKTTPTCHGSGCGLFVMKWCLESLGGELRIEPASECGNSVYFYLPSKSPPDDDAN
ncbi:MAG: histidine kinase-, DNA gyrase B-, and HSP90-like ATPase [Halonotius sp. J07HN4]|nr:MAG: histidine kinase-, DNA gyrase B-, and HSP90-like ATPase [Halonotius sp. J07HN4]